MPDNQLQVVDQRTDKSYQFEIEQGSIRAIELREIKRSDDDFGLVSYDPALKNTASTKSRITYIDGEQGVLRYRGYPIEQLADASNFPETSWLLLFGDLPRAEELETWQEELAEHALLHENIQELVRAFRYDAHPMGTFTSTVAALSTFYPDSRNVEDAESRQRNIKRLIAKVPAIAALTFRHSKGLHPVLPDPELSYAGNFLSMMFRTTQRHYKPNPVLERALEVLLILHADHEQNCSTTTMRAIGSSLADPYLSLAGAAGALSGPLHGGANQRVLQMLRRIGDLSNVPEFIERVKNREEKLMGFGHRVYKNYDPRAKIIKQMVGDIFEVTGRNPLLDIATELEKIALDDEFFVSRRLYPNVDFYSGIIYQAMGLPDAMFPVLFAMARSVGWLAQWEELLEDEEQKIARPRQIYIGEEERSYIPSQQR